MERFQLVRLATYAAQRISGYLASPMKIGEAIGITAIAIVLSALVFLLTQQAVLFVVILPRVVYRPQFTEEQAWSMREALKADQASVSHGQGQ